MGHQWQASVTIYLTLLPLFTANCWQDFLLKVEDIKKKKKDKISWSPLKKKEKKASWIQLLQNCWLQLLSLTAHAEPKL